MNAEFSHDGENVFAASSKGPSRRLISDQDIALYKERGYLHLRGILEPAVCDRLIEDIWLRMPERFVRSDPTTWTGRIQDCCNNLPIYQRKGLVRFKDKHGFAKQPVFRDAIIDAPVFSQIFTEITEQRCDKVWVRGLHPNLPMPKRISIGEAIGNRINWPVHSRYASLKIPRPPQIPIFGHLDVHPFELGMMVYLNDVEEGGGGLGVWPGSHGLFCSAFKAKYEFLPTGFYKRCLNLLHHYEPMVLSGGKGDIIVFHNRLMHANTVNTSDSVRYGILLDLFSADWRQRDQQHTKAELDQRRLFVSAKDINTLEPVRMLIAKFTPDRRRSFWADHPRLRKLIHSISQDPIGSARRSISAKIRSRVVGDRWLVVSQDPEHRQSFKLDAYGTRAGGRYSVFLNGERIGRSDGGVLVERLQLQPGHNVLRLTGRFKTNHFLRVVETGNPLPHSKILLSEKVPGGEGIRAAEFAIELPQER